MMKIQQDTNGERGAARIATGGDLWEQLVDLTLLVDRFCTVHNFPPDQLYTFMDFARQTVDVKYIDGVERGQQHVD